MMINMCDEDILSGSKAAEALDRYIKRLEKHKIKGLTQKQVNTLIKTARALRTAVVQTGSN